MDRALTSKEIDCSLAAYSHGTESWANQYTGSAYSAKVCFKVVGNTTTTGNKGRRAGSISFHVYGTERAVAVPSTKDNLLKMLCLQFQHPAFDLLNNLCNNHKGQLQLHLPDSFAWNWRLHILKYLVLRERRSNLFWKWLVAYFRQFNAHHSMLFMYKEKRHQAGMGKWESGVDVVSKL